MREAPDRRARMACVDGSLVVVDQRITASVGSGLSAVLPQRTARRVAARVGSTVAWERRSWARATVLRCRAVTRSNRA